MPYEKEAWKRARRARRNRMRRIVPEIKLFLGCSECGYRDHPDALQFDHIEGRHLSDGKVAAQRLPWTGAASWAALWRFVMDPNIDIKCANCHAIKSAEEQRERVGGESVAI